MGLEYTFQRDNKQVRCMVWNRILFSLLTISKKKSLVEETTDNSLSYKLTTI